MAESNVQYGGNSPLKSRRVYYAGTTDLTKNQPLCYVEDAKLASTTTEDGTNTKIAQDQRGVQVETPATASLKFFAGILSDGDTGKSESWVTILVPVRGDVLLARVEGTSNVAIGDGLELTDGNSYFTKDASETFDLTVLRALDAQESATPKSILCHRL